VKIVIVGGGKVGGYLAAQLNSTGHAVVVCETDARRAELLSEELVGLVIHGDGTDIETLLGADIERADWLLALTGVDETNLVACELGATLGARRSLARLNDPRNRGTFSALGIPVVAVTDLIGEVIERTLDPAQLERVTIIGAGAISLIELEIPENAPPRAVDDLDLPPDTLLITVADAEGLVTVPGPDTIIRAGNRVVAVTTLDREPLVRDALCETS
jgi:trk system potassium uptake protein TrkA